MLNLIEWGKTLLYKNTGTDTIKGGALVVLPDCVGVAVADIAPNDSGALNMEGVYDLPMASGALVQGAAVYADATGLITSTATDNTPAGIAWADSAGPSVPVKINA